jgi:two-component system LytT family response regulator
VRVLIVDDEPLARRGLRRELKRLPDVTWIGESASRDEAVTAIVEARPDIALLDVQLGRETAFEIIEEIGVDAMPLVVFVTAYDRHALKAFEVHALDYVLKPVDPDRLREALDRAASLLTLRRGASLAERLEGLLAKRPGSDPGEPAATVSLPPSERLVVRDGERLLLVDVDAIDWIESAGNYVRVHSGGMSYLMRTTMDRLADRLSGRGEFIRVRRSALINVRAVASIERYAKGMFVVQLRGGARVITSRYHQGALRGLLQAGGP